MNLKDLYRDDLLAIARQPDNMGQLNDVDVIVTEYNTACGDQVTVSIKLDKSGQKVADIKWQGSGCLVSQTAMSQVSNLVMGQTLAKIEKINIEQLLETMKLQEISSARRRCAQLGLTAVKKALHQTKKYQTDKLSISIPRKIDYIFVGSDNPVKIGAVAQAISHIWPGVKVMGLAVASSIGEQPMTDQETRIGSVNRAKAVLKTGLAQMGDSQTPRSWQALGIGLEGGVFKVAKHELWSTVWVSVVDEKGELFEANGARFRLPDAIAEPILNGEEMGPVVSQLMGGADIKRTNGAIGVVTNNFVDRTEEYGAIVKMAIGLWYGQDWQKQKMSNKFTVK